MSAYFLQLALQNLKRHVWLTALIVLVVSLGLGSSMTVYSILRAMSADPIAWKSDRLLTVQIDNLGPDNRRNGEPPVTLSVARSNGTASNVPRSAYTMWPLGAYRASLPPSTSVFGSPPSIDWTTMRALSQRLS